MELNKVISGDCFFAEPLSHKLCWGFLPDMRIELEGCLWFSSFLLPFFFVNCIYVVINYLHDQSEILCEGEEKFMIPNLSLSKEPTGFLFLPSKPTIYICITTIWYNLSEITSFCEVLLGCLKYIILFDFLINKC